MAVRPASGRRNLGRAFAALIASLWLCALPLHAQTISDVIAQALAERARAQGQVRVIVGLDAPTLPEGLLDPLRTQGQRAEISAAQAQVLGRLGIRDLIDSATVVHRLETVPFMALRVTPAQLQALQADPRVTSVFEDVPLPPTLDNSVLQISARGMWNRGFNGSGWAVAVLDTGIGYSHRAFAGAVQASACFSSNDPLYDATSLCPNRAPVAAGPRAARGCALSIDGCGHGTHVSATAMGRVTGRYRGVAPGAELIALQVFSRFPASSGLCRSASRDCVLSFPSDQLAALERVARMARTRNIAAVNMSIGGGYHSSACDTHYPAYTAVVNNLTSMGIAVVAAAGNDGFTSAVNFPACIRNVIAVGATNEGGRIARFSNQSARMTALMAPGVAIDAAYDGSPRATAQLSGTSMAAPHVAGAFALLRDAVPNASVARILAALRCTGTPVRRAGTPGRFPQINVQAARVQLIRGGQPGC